MDGLVIFDRQFRERSADFRCHGDNICGDVGVARIDKNSRQKFVKGKDNQQAEKGTCDDMVFEPIDYSGRLHNLSNRYRIGRTSLGIGFGPRYSSAITWVMEWWSGGVMDVGVLGVTVYLREGPANRAGVLGVCA